MHACLVPGQAVKWLWEIVSEFDDEEKRRFLKFFTGSDRAPIGGLGNLRQVLPLFPCGLLSTMLSTDCPVAPVSCCAGKSQRMEVDNSRLVRCCMTQWGPLICERTLGPCCRCIIQRDGTDSQKLPTAHTCFNTLLLPSYRSREGMADRLRLAIMNSEGFGLE